jgi:hypothetical protein
MRAAARAANLRLLHFDVTCGMKAPTLLASNYKGVDMTVEGRRYIAVAVGIGLVCGWLGETFDPPAYWNPGHLWGIILGGAVFGAAGYLIVRSGLRRRSYTRSR